MGVRQSSRSIVAMAATSPTAHAYANTSGHRQPGETCAREAARPGSQGTKAVHGPWCSAGEAGRHLRTKAGYGQRLRALCPSRCDWNGSQLRHSNIPTWRAPRSPSTWMWRCWNGRVGVSTRTVPLEWTGSPGRRTRPIGTPTWWHDTKNSSMERPVRNRWCAD